jgi:hypothetical protein
MHLYFVLLWFPCFCRFFSKVTDDKKPDNLAGCPRALYCCGKRHVKFKRVVSSLLPQNSVEALQATHKKPDFGRFAEHTIR